MTGSTAIFLKEFVQSVHHRRTFAFRTVLPFVAMVILMAQVAEATSGAAQDWRSLAAAGRPIFRTLAWLGLITLSAFALLTGKDAFQREWKRRTMPLLLAAPLSPAGIVAGKFAAVLGKVSLAALSLMPVWLVALRIGRLPGEIAGGAWR